jgi:hypothetical protein
LQQKKLMQQKKDVTVSFIHVHRARPVDFRGG